jgi:hypothetical protein
VSRNPFKPTAGASPPLLVGREDVLEAWADSLDNGPGSPGRITIYTGGRGVGKTVMLNEVGNIARESGWLVIDETATPGFVGRIHHAIVRYLKEWVEPSGRRVTGGRVGPISVTTQLPEEGDRDLSTDLRSLLDSLARHETGLVLTLDEVHRRSGADDLAVVAAITQHMVREGRDFGVAMAGLPQAISELLTDAPITTFMRRADRHELNDVQPEAVAQALREPIEQSGKHIEDQALTAAVEATGGYPFLIQLVGFHVWKQSREGAIDSDAVRAGVDAARRRFGSLVQEPALQDLSEVDRTFLAAMAADDGPTSVSDIQLRMGITKNGPQYVNEYRNRLIKSDMIRQVGRGRVDYALPFLREYLRDHAATLGLSIASQPEEGE